MEKLALNITEEEYRALPALSYSAIARYSREGYSCIPHLFEPISSPSLTLGSVLDCLITEGFDVFNKKYFVSAFNPENKSSKVYMDIYKIFYDNPLPIGQLIDKYPDEIEVVMNNNDYYKNKVFKSRIKELLDYSAFYEDIIKANNRIIISQDMYEDANKMYQSLFNNHLTHGILFDDKSSMKKYWQIKFQTNLAGIDVKCMFDLLLVNDNNKTIYPVDLKTTSTEPYKFFDSFVHWGYQIQVRLYTQILKNVIKNTKYENYKISTYKYVVVNKNFNNPLVFDIPFSLEEGDLEIEGFKFKDPITIAEELKKELDCYASGYEYPSNIDVTKVNNILKAI